MNGGLDIELGSEEQNEKGVPRHEDERLKEKGEEKSELIKEIAYLRGENAKLKSNIEELENE